MKKIDFKSNKILFLLDIIKNIFAFGIYIISMQIIFLPYMSRNLDYITNSKLLTYIVILNLFTMSIGQQLGITLQIYTGDRDEKKYLHDFRLLNLISNIAVFLLTFIIILFLKFGFVNALILSIISTLTNNRFYYVAHFRNNKNFNKVTISNIFYFLGILLGIAYCYLINTNFWLPILLAEIFANAYVYISLNELRGFRIEKTNHFIFVLKDYFNLMLSAFLSNIPVYTDKLLVLPLLGTESMSIYYAGTALSKALFLIVNPVSAVLLAWLSNSNYKNVKELVKKYIKINLLLIIGIFALNLPLTYLATKILYNHLFESVLNIIIPISVTATVQISSSFLNVIMLRYYNSINNIYVNLTSIISFIIFGVLGARIGGLYGFAWGMSFSKILIWIAYTVIMIYSTPKQDN